MLRKCFAMRGMATCRLLSTSARLSPHCHESTAAPTPTAAMTAEDLSIAAINHKKKMNILLQNNLYKDKKHPIYNFLFTYVFINPKILFQYSPGVDTDITGISSKGDSLS